MSDLRVSLFYGFPLWDDTGIDSRSPNWFREYADEKGKKNTAFDKAIKEGGLKVVEYRCGGATYSDSEYFLAVKASVLGGEEGIHALGQELPKISQAWQKLLIEFCQKYAEKFSIAYKTPEFILCGYSAD